MFPFIECSLFIALYFTMFGLIRRLSPRLSCASSKKDAIIFHAYLISLVHCLATMVFGKARPAHPVAIFKLAVYGIHFCQPNERIMELIVTV